MFDDLRQREGEIYALAEAVEWLGRAGRVAAFLECTLEVGRAPEVGPAEQPAGR